MIFLQRYSNSVGLWGKCFAVKYLLRKLLKVEEDCILLVFLSFRSQILFLDFKICIANNFIRSLRHFLGLKNKGLTPKALNGVWNAKLGILIVTHSADQSKNKTTETIKYGKKEEALGMQQFANLETLQEHLARSCKNFHDSF